MKSAALYSARLTASTLTAALFEKYSMLMLILWKNNSKLSTKVYILLTLHLSCVWLLIGLTTYRG